MIDEGGWASFRPVERSGRLIGVRIFHRPLTGPPASRRGKPPTDAESLAREDYHWLVSFERNHRYRFRRSRRPRRRQAATSVSSSAPRSNEGSRRWRARRPAVRLRRSAAGTRGQLRILGKAGHRTGRGGAGRATDPLSLPTAADLGSAGTAYILFRSVPVKRQSGCVLAVVPAGARTLATHRSIASTIARAGAPEEGAGPILHPHPTTILAPRHLRPGDWSATLLMSSRFSA